MNWFSLFIFLLIFWSWGRTVFILTKTKKNFFEINIMSLGVGLALFPVVSFLLNKLGLAIDWRLYLALGLIIPSYYLFIKLYKKKKIFDSMSIRESPWSILVVLGFIFVLYVMLVGSFKIPYLENGDPYEYSVAAKYIKYEKTYSKGNLYLAHYLEPYPPAYSGLMGVAHQTNDDLLWTLKFFNALLVSLAILFSYYFFRVFLKSSKISAISAFGLAMIPCFSSHFIFSQTLSITMFFPVFYMLFMVSENKWWGIPASIGIGGFIVTQTSTAMGIAGFIGIFLFLSILINGFSRKTKLYLASAFGGLLIGVLLFWGPILLSYEYSDIQMQLTMGQNEHRTIIKASDFFADYKFADFFYAPVANKIDNPQGFGPVIFILIFIGFLFLAYMTNNKLKDKKNKRIFQGALVLIFISLIIHSIKAHRLFVANGGKAYVYPGITIWLILTAAGFIALSYVLFVNRKSIIESAVTNDIILIFWFIWGIMGVLGDYLPFGWLPNRFWSLLAIPASMLLGYSIVIMANTLSSQLKGKLKITARLIFIFFILIIITMTGGLAKKAINTSFWPQHRLSNVNELNGYLAIKENLPKETLVFDACRKNMVISYNMLFPVWEEDVIKYVYTPKESESYGWDKVYIFSNKNRTILKSPILSRPEDEVYKWLREKQFKYLIISDACNSFYPGQEGEIKDRITALNKNPNFGLVLNVSEEFYLFKIG